MTSDRGDFGDLGDLPRDRAEAIARAGDAQAAAGDG
jgi:hypothetical protein